MQYGAGIYTDCMSTEHQHIAHGVKNFARTSKRKFSVTSEMLFNTIKMKVADTLQRKMLMHDERIDHVGEDDGSSDYDSLHESVVSVDEFANLPTYKSHRLFFEDAHLMYMSRVGTIQSEKKYISYLLHPFLSENQHDAGLLPRCEKYKCRHIFTCC